MTFPATGRPGSSAPTATARLSPPASWTARAFPCGWSPPAASTNAGGWSPGELLPREPVRPGGALGVELTERGERPRPVDGARAAVHQDRHADRLSRLSTVLPPAGPAVRPGPPATGPQPAAGPCRPAARYKERL